LQNSIKFGTEVGFPYQSPPPLYFITAIFTDVPCVKASTGKKNNIIRPTLRMILICFKDKNIEWFRHLASIELQERVVISKYLPFLLRLFKTNRKIIR
jgi:hypothetical protein